MTERRWDKGSGVSGGQVRLSEKGCFSGERGGGGGGTHCSGVQEWGSKQKEEEENSRPPLLQTFRSATNRVPRPMTCFSSSSSSAASLLLHILFPRPALRRMPRNTSLAAGCTTVYHACIHPPTPFAHTSPAPLFFHLADCGGLRLLRLPLRLSLTIADIRRKI